MVSFDKLAELFKVVRLESVATAFNRLWLAVDGNQFAGWRYSLRYL
jgi:hypothetical protein